MKNSKQLTEIAVLTALYMVLLVIIFLVPVLGTLLIWALPLPFIFCAVRNGKKAAIVMFALTLVLSLIFGLQALPLTWAFASTGVVIGELYRRKRSAFQILLGGTLTYTAHFVLLYILFIVITDINPVTDVVNTLRDMLVNADQFSQQLLPGGSEDQTDALIAQLELIQYVIPSMLIIASFIFALLTQLLANLFLRRLQYDVPAWKPFRKWSLPKSVIWYYLAVLVLSLIGLEEGSTLFVVTANLLLILENAMIVQGFTVIFAYSKIKEWSLVWPIVAAIGSVLLVLPLQLVKLLGIVDLGFDLRKRMNH